MFGSIKSREKNRTEVHVYELDRCQADLFMDWLVCACITIFHEVIKIFFGSTLQAKYILVDVSWHRVVRANALHCYQYKDFNHRCKDGYILGKTPVSLPITAGYSLSPT